MHNENLDRIQQFSRTFSKVLNGMILLIPVLTVLYWYFFNQLPKGFVEDLPVVATGDLTAWQLTLGCLVSFIPVCVAILGLLNLRRLFSLYQQGVVFSVQNTQCIRKLGFTLFLWVAANKVFVSLMSLVISANFPIGQRMFVLELNYADLATLVLAFVVVLISWVMQEAAALEDEIKHTV